ADELAALIEARLVDEPIASLLERLQQAGVPAAPVNDVGQVADHEQTTALGLVQPLPKPTVPLPLSFEGERVLHRRPPPRLGEHTSEILGELGYAGDEIERMNAQGIVRRVKSNA